MKEYSVLLLLPDYMAEDYGTDTYFDWVTAATPTKAVRASQVRAAKQHRSEGAQCRAADYHPLVVVDGYHKDLTPDKWR